MKRALFERQQTTAVIPGSLGKYPYTHLKMTFLKSAHKNHNRDGYLFFFQFIYCSIHGAPSFTRTTVNKYAST